MNKTSKVAFISGAALTFFSTGLVQGAELAKAQDLSGGILVAGSDSGCAGADGGCSSEGGAKKTSTKKKDSKKGVHAKTPKKAKKSEDDSAAGAKKTDEPSAGASQPSTGNDAQSAAKPEAK